MEMTVRSFVLSALAVTAFSATMAVDTPEANAVVYCAAGVYRAGCVADPSLHRPCAALHGVLLGVLFGGST